MPISKEVRWFARGSLMAVAIFLGSSYIIKWVTSPPSMQQKTSQKDTKYQAVNDAKFRSLFDAGNKALGNGQYNEALASFLEAERSAEQLTDDQYESLRKSRLQIAQIYEAAGNISEAENVYHALIDCGIREGDAFMKAHQPERALARYQDTEQFSDRLSVGRQEALQRSRSSLVYCLTEMHRYPEAAAASQRMIDYLKVNVSDFDPAFSDNYKILAATYDKAKDWHAFEQALNLEIESCDKTLAHFSSADYQIVGMALINKNIAMHDLIVAYYFQGNADLALSKADEVYADALEHPPSQGFHAQDIATLALQIATEAKKQDAIYLWQERLRNQNGGIVTLR